MNTTTTSSLEPAPSDLHIYRFTAFDKSPDACREVDGEFEIDTVQGFFACRCAGEQQAWRIAKKCLSIIGDYSVDLEEIKVSKEDLADTWNNGKGRRTCRILA